MIAFNHLLWNYWGNINFKPSMQNQSPNSNATNTHTKKLKSTASPNKSKTNPHRKSIGLKTCSSTSISIDILFCSTPSWKLWINGSLKKFTLRPNFLNTFFLMNSISATFCFVSWIAPSLSWKIKRSLAMRNYFSLNCLVLRKYLLI